MQKTIPTFPAYIENEKTRHLVGALTAFSQVSQVPVVFFNEAGEITWQSLKEKKLCSLFSDESPCQKGCRKNLRLARETALKLREPYIFLCEAGLINIMFPFICENSVKGSFLAGPVAMGAERDSTIKKLLKKITPAHEMTPALLTFLNSMQIRTPLETSYLYEVFCNCVFSYHVLENNFGLIYRDSKKDAAENLSASAIHVHYPDDLTEQLIHAVKSGDKQAAMHKFRLFYEKTYLIESGNLNLIKARLMEIFNTLSRSTPAENSASYYLEELESLYNAFSFSEAYRISQSLIRRLVSSTASVFYQGSSAIIKKTVDYIHEHFSQDISLISAAGAVHTNASYLSTLFKKEMNQTFSSYLTQIRLHNSEKLLRETHISITEIAMTCGFSSQSYFIKKFKEVYGTTPSLYRKTLSGS